MLETTTNIPLGLIVPLIVLQFILFIVAIIDLVRIPKTNGPKWLWVIILLIGGIIGSIVYFIVGRKQS